MSSLQAAIWLAQLERLDDSCAQEGYFSWYETRLRDVRDQAEPQAVRHRNTYWMVTIIRRSNIWASQSRDGWITLTGMASIPALLPPLSSLPAFAGAPDVGRARECNTVAYNIGAARREPAIRTDSGRRAGRLRVSVVRDMLVRQKNMPGTTPDEAVILAAAGESESAKNLS